MSQQELLRKVIAVLTALKVDYIPQDNKASGILTYDGNHFNDQGHQFVAEQMLKKFR